ncbi:hypothetical protein [Ensifer sp. SL37]|uniref:hypothetical protein n=1 Tax=Ensifer sp. SL37 TaxID=2995137 RepID=UPI00227409BE|nr:hypothetical protein [Ensifer sp. SL37]MCY1740950.1 hypothetical protein [Ensifer sp. SL37]
MNANHFNLNELVKFLGRDDWALQFEEVMGDHFWPVMDEFGLDHEEIDEVLGPHWTMTLWGCAFEDFLTQAFEPDGRTFVDIYLKSRGFKETARSKTYLKAISTSVISLYEVSEIVPCKSFLARDLLRGGDPVTVSEGTATQTLRQWEKIAARIVHVGDTNVITGGLLPYSPEASEALLEGLKEMSGKKRSRKKLILDDDTLRLAAPLFTHAWLFDTLPRMLGDNQAIVCNSDGDDIVFHEVRFPLETGITEKDIAERFAGLVDLRQENPTFWNWLGRPPARGAARPGHPDALVAGVTMEDGTPVLGSLEVKGRFLVLMVNSAERAQRGTERLQNILGKMVRTPLTSIQTIEQLKAVHQGTRPSADDIPPEVATPLVHAMLDRQYRATLDEPVGMLGDISPRAAARTKAGRQKVAEWLKYLEMRSSAAPDPNDPMATYDFGWIWKELKVEDLRR